ncbi:SHOCT-like domain-containing protein [Deinococcus hohokamensis]|uniref:YvlB/LiaX N-terminal domain-containing protein n=1 Tax=Deinococcus hohokamensis TaxID=309883 RepID=A0ABV9IDY4_9DEIO
MKEKVKRILELVRAGKLSLEDAGPLLAALNARLALTDSDRELVASLLARDELDAGQVAEHLLLLRGVRDTAPPPPFPPFPPRGPRVVVGGRPGVPMDGFVDRLTGSIDGFVDRITEQVERAVEGPSPQHRGAGRGGSSNSARLLRVQVESSSGDEYAANLPVSLAPHLHKLIPPHGLAALESAGLSIEALQLLIEADPPPGDLINAEDSSGNSVRISLK